MQRPQGKRPKSFLWASLYKLGVDLSNAEEDDFTFPEYARGDRSD